MNFANRFLSIKGSALPLNEVSTFKKNEIIKIFHELGYTCKFEKGGWYEIEKKFEEYLFSLSFQIKYNAPLIYPYVYKKGNLIDSGLGHFSYMLNFLNYDKDLIDSNFRINTLSDLKRFICEIVSLFDEFCNIYIQEIQDGKNPEYIN